MDTFAPDQQAAAFPPGMAAHQAGPPALFLPDGTPVRTPPGHAAPVLDSAPVLPAPAAPLPVMPVEIARAIVEVCRHVTRLRLDGVNTHDNYRFTSIDQFLEVVGSWCSAAGLIVLPEEVQVLLHEMDRWKNGQWVGRKPVLSCTYRFWLIHESGAMWQHPMERRVSLAANGPQSYGAAESYVLKRFLRALFKVPSGDALDPTSDVFDPDTISEGRGPLAPRPQPAQQPPAGLFAPPPPMPVADPLFGPGPDRRPPAEARFSGRVVERGGTPGNTGGSTGWIPGAPGGWAAQPPAQTPGEQGAPVPSPAPSPDPSPASATAGQLPYRVYNGMGEVIAELRDLQAWGGALKRHLARFPAAYAANLPEIDRLESLLLSNPTLSDRARTNGQAAFASLRALDPARQPSPDPAAPSALQALRTGEEFTTGATDGDPSHTPEPGREREPGEEG